MHIVIVSEVMTFAYSSRFNPRSSNPDFFEVEQKVCVCCDVFTKINIFLLIVKSFNSNFSEPHLCQQQLHTRGVAAQSSGYLLKHTWSV